MMHETMTGISHGWRMYGFGPLTVLIILILVALGLVYIIQETTQNKQQEE